MAPEKQMLRTSYDAEKTLQPIYTGGKVALDESGRILFTTLNDEVIVTDFETGDELARIEGDEEVITTFSITPNASHIATCSRSQTMRIYALSPTLSPPSVTPKLLRSTRAHDAPVIVSTIDRTGTLLATGGAEGLVKVWDLRGGYVTHSFRGHGGVVSALRFYSPEDADQWKLASGADDCTVRIWSLKTRKAIAALESHVSVIRGLDWSEDGAVLASGSRDKVVVLWDTRKWKQRNTIPVLEEVETVGFLESEGEAQVLYTGGQKNRVRLWDVNKGSELTEDVPSREENEGLGISDIIYLPSVPSILSVHNDQTLVLHSLPAVRTSSGLQLPIIKTLSGHHDEIIDLAFVSPTRSHLALASNSETIRIIDPATFGDVGLLEGHSEIVLTIDTDASGTWLASSGKDNDARLWHLDIESKEFKCVATCTGHAESVGACALSRTPSSDPSKPPAFLVTGSQDRTIKLWDFSKGKPKAVYTRRAHEKDINAIDVSPDDSLFASASQDRTVKIWDRASGETVGVLRGHKRGVWTVRFAPHSVNAALFPGTSEAGKLIATGAGDKTIKIWNLSSFTCLRTLEGHANSILKLLWVSQGTQLVSAAGDGLLKLWDLKKGETSLTMDNHTDRVWALATREDGDVIASGGADSTITIWKDITASTAAAEAEANKILVKQEQQLQNLVAVQDYRSAISLALTLDRPGQLLNIFREALFGEKVNFEERKQTEEAVAEVIAELSDDQTVLLLNRVRDWNTSAKTADLAQRILNMVLRSHDLFRLSQRVSRSAARWRAAEEAGEEEAEAEGKKNVRKGLGKGGMLGLVKALEAYSEKHYERMEGIWEESWCLEYTLERMGMVLE